jgi:hypothetical protein
MNNIIGLSVLSAQNVLNCTESYVYQLIKAGELEVASSYPTRVSASSIIKRMETRNPFLAKCRTSIDYHVREMVHG